MAKGDLPKKTVLPRNETAPPQPNSIDVPRPGGPFIPPSISERAREMQKGIPGSPLGGLFGQKKL